MYQSMNPTNQADFQRNEVVLLVENPQTHIYSTSSLLSASRPTAASDPSYSTRQSLDSIQGTTTAPSTSSGRRSVSFEEDRQPNNDGNNRNKIGASLMGENSHISTSRRGSYLGLDQRATSAPSHIINAASDQVLALQKHFITLESSSSSKLNNTVIFLDNDNTNIGKTPGSQYGIDETLAALQLKDTLSIPSSSGATTTATTAADDVHPDLANVLGEASAAHISTATTSPRTSQESSSTSHRNTSSIDYLLASTPTSSTSRHSLDSLQELLSMSANPLTIIDGATAVTAAAIDGNNNNNNNNNNRTATGTGMPISHRFNHHPHLQHSNVTAADRLRGMVNAAVPSSTSPMHFQSEEGLAGRGLPNTNSSSSSSSSPFFPFSSSHPSTPLNISENQHLRVDRSMPHSLPHAQLHAQLPPLPTPGSGKTHFNVEDVNNGIALVTETARANASNTSSSSAASMLPQHKSLLFDSKSAQALLLDRSSPSRNAFKRTSLTIVAEPKRNTAFVAPTGPSVGALASTVVDHHQPTGSNTAGTSTSTTHSKDMNNCTGGGGSHMSTVGSNQYPSNQYRLQRDVHARQHGTATVAAGTGTGTGGAGMAGGNKARSSTLSSTSMAVPIARPLIPDADLHETFGAHAWYIGPSTTAAPASTSNTARTTATTILGKSLMHTAASSSPPVPKQRPSSLTNRCSGGVMMPPPKLFGPTSVKGQHSITFHDSRCNVPTYEYLRQRRYLVEQERQSQADASAGINASSDSSSAKGSMSMSGGGFIAEAKRVLSEAMKNATRTEADCCDTNYSGAIGPLLKHLRRAHGNENDTRAALRTLSLLVSNLPNRAIISELNGRHIIAGAMRQCSALDIEEQAVQLLWDLDTQCGKDAAPVLEVEDVFALLKLLGETKDASIASHALHLLRAALELPPGSRIPFTSMQVTEIAQKVVAEVCSHKHHLQDAAQYTLGGALAAVLIDPGVSDSAAVGSLQDLLQALLKCSNPLQCQVLLTVLSSLAGKHRLRTLLGSEECRSLMTQFAQQTGDSRLQARALSLLKVLNKEENGHGAASWYFGD